MDNLNIKQLDLLLESITAIIDLTLHVHDCAFKLDANSQPIYSETEVKLINKSDVILDKLMSESRRLRAQLK